MAMDKKFWAESAGGGIIITLLTFFYNSTPGRGLAGAIWYGFPLTWIRYLVVNTQQYSPWAVDFAGLIADIIIWVVVVAVVLFFAERMKKGKVVPAGTRTPG